MRIDTIDQNDLSLSVIGNETNTSSSYMSDVSETEPDLLNLACANARSVVEKISSLVTLFEEKNLDFALLTETWLTQKACPKRKMDDLTIGANLSFIRRDRGSRGGGCLLYTSDAADE